MCRRTPLSWRHLLDGAVLIPLVGAGAAPRVEPGWLAPILVIRGRGFHFSAAPAHLLRHLPMQPQRRSFLHMVMVTQSTRVQRASRSVLARIAQNPASYLRFGGWIAYPPWLRLVFVADHGIRGCAYLLLHTCQQLCINVTSP